MADESIIVSYVATDNYRGGVLAAREMAKRLDGKGNAILLRYHVGSESTEQREQGFLETLRKEFPDIKIISDDQYGGTTPLEAQNKALELCNQFGDRLNGFFAVCESNSVGVLGAFEQERLAGKVVFIAFDPGPQLVPALAPATSTASCCKTRWRWAMRVSKRWSLIWPASRSKSESRPARRSPPPKT